MAEAARGGSPYNRSPLTPCSPRAVRCRSYRFSQRTDSMANILDTHGAAPPNLMTRAGALKAAVRFVREEGQAPPVLLDTGRPFVLDVISREWHVVFEEEADPSLALLTGSFQPRYCRVAVHAETGACRWVEE